MVLCYIATNASQRICTSNKNGKNKKKRMEGLVPSCGDLILLIALRISGFG